MPGKLNIYFHLQVGYKFSHAETERTWKGAGLICKQNHANRCLLLGSATQNEGEENIKQKSINSMVLICGNEFPGKEARRRMCSDLVKQLRELMWSNHVLKMHKVLFWDCLIG